MFLTISNSSANMKVAVTLLCLVIVFVKRNEAKDFTLGSRVDNLLIKTDKVQVGAIPFWRRDKDYTYTDPKFRAIKGIMVKDLDRSDADVTLLEGGIGENFVKLHLESERGSRLNYQILIFADKACSIVKIHD